MHHVVELATEATEGDVDEETIEDVHEVIEELAEFVEEVDMTEGAKALEFPDDPENARDAVDIPELDERVDLRDAWREFRELQDEVEELRANGEDGESDDDSLMDWDDGESDTDDMDTDDIHSTELELAIQSAVAEAVEKFREEILAARERLKDAIEDIDDRTVDDPDSRNPAAFSMLPSARGDIGGVARESTVPKETRYSKTPNFDRIYGDRFDDASGDDDE